MPRQIADGLNISTAIAGAGGGGNSPLFGDGSLGDVTINTLVETSGDLHYNTLTVDVGGRLTAVALRALVVRSIGAITVDGAIDADGRGFAATAGGKGADQATAEDGVASAASSANWGPAISGGGSGGSGASGTEFSSTLGGASGDALDQSTYTDQLASLASPPIVAGAPTPVLLPGTHKNNGSSAPNYTGSDQAFRFSADYGLGWRSRVPMGRGGTGGGGGGCGSNAPSGVNTGGSGGAPGTGTGASVGAGFNGNDGQQFCGGGGGGGGRGGGHVQVWCGGDLNIGGSARITALGGDGGNGGANGAGSPSFAGGGGGAGAGGGGGFVGVFYAGTLTNLGTVNANGGSGGSVTGTNPGATAGAAAPGIFLIAKVA